MDLVTWIKQQWDRAAAAVLFVFGLLALLLGYIGIAGKVYPAEQLPYMISGGVLGLFLLGSAGILYLSADMRDEWRKLDSLEATLKELSASLAVATPEAEPEVVAPVAEIRAPKGPVRAKTPVRTVAKSPARSRRTPADSGA